MQVQQPTKQQVRDYLAARRASPTPPPQPADVRRELGWNLYPATRTDDITR